MVVCMGCYSSGIVDIYPVFEFVGLSSIKKKKIIRSSLSFFFFDGDSNCFKGNEREREIKKGRNNRKDGERHPGCGYFI